MGFQASHHCAAMQARMRHGGHLVVRCSDSAECAAVDEPAKCSSLRWRTSSQDEATTAHLGKEAAATNEQEGEQPCKRVRAHAPELAASLQVPTGASADRLLRQGVSLRGALRNAVQVSIFDKEDCVIPVLQHLDVPSVLRLCQVNVMLRRACESHDLWAGFCLRDFGEDSSAILSVYEKAQIPGSPGTVIRVSEAGSRTLYKGIRYQQIYRNMLTYEIELHFISGPMESFIIKVDGTQCTNRAKTRKEGERSCGESCEQDHQDARHIVSIGRSRTNDISILQDEMVSRKHGEIFREGAFYWFKDVGSINGTFINSEQIPAEQPHKLRIGDLVEMGATRWPSFVYVCVHVGATRWQCEPRVFLHFVPISCLRGRDRERLRARLMGLAH